MSRGKTSQNVLQRGRHKYAELSRFIASCRRRIKREGSLPPKLQQRYQDAVDAATKLRPNVR